ncbi:MAG TPA: subtilase family N-terminal domain-containing protein, partial [Gemmatimonadaceae bacterium]|nr:subtilase family N-terminal domain-containing protein [Gemmatimonadaceae bacterium]
MKRYLWLFVACLALAWGGPAGAAPEKPGEEIAFQLRMASAGPIAEADGRARFGIPALDRILERHGARGAEPVFRVGHGTNHELRARLGMDRYFKVRLPRGADFDAAARELRGVGDVAWVSSGERMTLHAEIAPTSGSAGVRSLAEGTPSGGTLFGQVPQFTPTSSLATATSHGPESIPNDPDFPKQWHLRNTGANPGVSTSLTADADMDVASAWTIETGDPGVVVAIVDTGFKLDAPDLDDRLWSNPGEIPGNGIDDDSNGYTDDIVGYDFYYDDATPNVFP